MVNFKSFLPPIFQLPSSAFLYLFPYHMHPLPQHTPFPHTYTYLLTPPMPPTFPIPTLFLLSYPRVLCGLRRLDLTAGVFLMIYFQLCSCVLIRSEIRPTPKNNDNKCRPSQTFIL